MTNTLIVPGLDSSPAPHWQEWWARSERDALLVDMGDPARPVRELWQAILASQVLRHPGCVLVGHSLGAVTIADLLTRWPDLPVRGALLVAPANPALSERTRCFGGLPRGRFEVPAIVVASRNDPWMSFDQARRLSEGWGADLYDIGHAGHVNVASGFGPWARGQALRDALLARTARPSLLRRLMTARSA